MVQSWSMELAGSDRTMAQSMLEDPRYAAATSGVFWVEYQYYFQDASVLNYWLSKTKFKSCSSANFSEVTFVLQ